MDKVSFEKLYVELLPGLYRLAQSILRNEADAQDAVQSAAANAWAANARIRPGCEKAYITRIVINECRNIQRFRMRQLTQPYSSGYCSYLPEQTGLKEAIEMLPEKYRLPLLLMYMEGYSELEISEIMGISQNATKSRLRRARKKLEKNLKDMNGEEEVK